jgi:hypothetical protein
MTIENEPTMGSNETKAKAKKTSPKSQESLHENQDMSGYEFQEIANVEGWSSMENEHYMTVNNLSH